MDVAAGADFRTMVVQELNDLPDEEVVEVLDFVRFLKQRLSHVTPEERFDRLWMVARCVASEGGITDEDIAAEVEAVRRGK